jgi:hypothetical protein
LRLVLDSSGLKVSGEGDGFSKRRTWRKIHLAVDSETGEIPAMEFHGSEVVQPILEEVEHLPVRAAGNGSSDRREVDQALPEHCHLPSPGRRECPGAVPLARWEPARSLRREAAALWRKRRFFG